MKFVYTFVTTLAVIYSFGFEAKKDPWIKDHRAAHIKDFCQKHKYQLQCYSVSKEQCRDYLTIINNICVNMYYDQIPDIMTQPKEAKYWGDKLYSCEEKNYVIGLKHKYIEKSICEDKEYWKSK